MFLNKIKIGNILRGRSSFKCPSNHLPSHILKTAQSGVHFHEIPSYQHVREGKRHVPFLLCWLFSHRCGETKMKHQTTRESFSLPNMLTPPPIFHSSISQGKGSMDYINMLGRQPELGPVLLSATGKQGFFTYVCTGLFLKLALFFSVYSISIKPQRSWQLCAHSASEHHPFPAVHVLSTCFEHTTPWVIFNLVTSMETRR